MCMCSGVCVCVCSGVCVCVCVCLHTNISFTYYTCMHACMHACTCHTDARIHKHTLLHGCMDACMHMQIKSSLITYRYIHTHTCTHTHTHTHADTDTHRHTHTHTHTHTKHTTHKDTHTHKDTGIEHRDVSGLLKRVRRKQRGLHSEVLHKGSRATHGSPGPRRQCTQTLESVQENADGLR